MDCRSFLLCYIFQQFGFEKASEFFLGYLIEKLLSIDNIFVFITIFKLFNISPSKQKVVLFWGIIGAIILRGLFILLGVIAIEQLSWILHIFGLLLIYSAYKMTFNTRQPSDKLNDYLIFRLFSKFVIKPLKKNDQFFTNKNGKWYITPLFLVLLIIEISDIIFAIDSIPAIFAITQDFYIIFTSNIFAILGLRSLFFVILSSTVRFVYLQYGLSLTLLFIGTKLVLNDFIHIPIAISVIVIFTILIFSMVFSLLMKKNVNKL